MPTRRSFGTAFLQQNAMDFRGSRCDPSVFDKCPIPRPRINEVTHINLTEIDMPTSASTEINVLESNIQSIRVRTFQMQESKIPAGGGLQEQSIDSFGPIPNPYPP